MMVSRNILDVLPLWGVYLVTALLSLLAIELGYQLGRIWQRRSHVDKEGPVGALSGATLGLLAFLLAFIIGMAMTRFDARRLLVVDEANAIGTTYLRAGFLDEPIRGESRALLREYVDVRIQANALDRLAEARIRAEQIHAELWSRAEVVARENPDSPIVALYIETLNDLIDIHAKRIAAITSSRIPGSIWLGVYFVVILTMALVGLQSSYSERLNWLAVLLLLLVFAAVLTLIVDLDRPWQGLLRVSQQALLDLQAQLAAPMP
jgi:hypothetical protein